MPIKQWLLEQRVSARMNWLPLKRLPHRFAASWPPNMSLGANVMIQALALIAKALGDDYNIETIEDTS